MLNHINFGIFLLTEDMWYFIQNNAWAHTAKHTMMPLG